MTVVEARRPKLVTLVGVLVVISGILDVLLGLVWLFYEPDGAQSTTVGPWLGVGFLVVGVVQIAVARGLLRGDDRARTVVTIVVVLDIVMSIVALTAGRNPRALSFSDILFAVVVLVVLYTPRANAFFGRRTLTSDASRPPG